MSGDNPYENHGHSVAAWTGVGICMLGSFVVALGVWFGHHLLSFIGAAVFLAGGLIGWAMGRAASGRAVKHGAMDSEQKAA